MVQRLRALPQASLREKGAVMIIMAASMFMLLGITAIVIDVANFQQLKRQAQATVDASVLAGAYDLAEGVGDETQVDAAIAGSVKAYAAANMNIPLGAWTTCTDSSKPVAFTKQVDGESCISMSGDDTLLRVALPVRTAKTFFASILGFGGWTINVGAEAEVEKAVSHLDADSPFASGYDIKTGDPGGDYGPCENLGAMSGEWNTTADGTPTGATLAIFVFEHRDGTTTVLCGTTAKEIKPTGNTFWFEGIGGTSKAVGGANTERMDMHVSCSESWKNGSTDPTEYPPEDGWANPGKGSPHYGDPEGHFNEAVGAPKGKPKPPKVPVLKGDPPSEKDISNYEKALAEYPQKYLDYEEKLVTYLSLPAFLNYYSAEGNDLWKGIQPSGDLGDPEWRVLRAIMVKTTVDDTGAVIYPEDSGADRNVCPGKDIERFLPGETTTAHIRLSN